RTSPARASSPHPPRPAPGPPAGRSGGAAGRSPRWTRRGSPRGAERTPRARPRRGRGAALEDLELHLDPAVSPDRDRAVPLAGVVERREERPVRHTAPPRDAPPVGGGPIEDSPRRPDQGRIADPERRLEALPRPRVADGAGRADALALKGVGRLA